MVPKNYYFSHLKELTQLSSSLLSVSSSKNDNDNDDAELVRSLVLSRARPRQARSLSRLRPASFGGEEEDDKSSAQRGRVRYRGELQTTNVVEHQRSASVSSSTISHNQLLPCTLSTVKFFEVNRKQVTFVPGRKKLPKLQIEAGVVQLPSYQDHVKRRYAAVKY